MGIKGIYGEIGPGQRVSFTKIAVDQLERTGRPLRLAVDISIWSFQIQSGKGGSNPAIRTLYYRLIKLLSLAVNPLFVFDGSQKPAFKRNKKVGSRSSYSDLLTKELLSLFGFPFITAPGEAEAECALLQQKGIVDAVLSEDVDTLMFGSGLTFRNWSTEGSKGKGAPTHVSVYDKEVMKQNALNLDRPGMILVAMMSGGDYIVGGVPKCGIKVACEAARAGWGDKLLANTTPIGLAAWRDQLSHELQKNENKHFRVKHKALKIPPDFPDTDVLKYYTHPIVSSATELEKLQKEIKWGAKVDVINLRAFVANTFEWKNKKGATKFIRGLAPGLLTQVLATGCNQRYLERETDGIHDAEKGNHVSSICGKRVHFSTDGLPELRVVYRPSDVVPIKLDEEHDSSEGEDDGSLDSNIDDDADLAKDRMQSNEDPQTQNRAPRNVSKYDPHDSLRIWIPSVIAQIGIPSMVKNYEESILPAPKTQKKTAVRKPAFKNTGMPKGALDRYVTIIKPTSTRQSCKSCLPTKDQPGSKSLPQTEKTKPGGHRLARSSQNSLPGLDFKITKVVTKSTCQAAISEQDGSRGAGQHFPPTKDSSSSPKDISQKMEDSLIESSSFKGPSRTDAVLPSETPVADLVAHLTLSLEPTSPSNCAVLKQTPPQATKAAKARGGQRYFMLRESLEGSWKEIDNSEHEGIAAREEGSTRRVWRKSEVEILDMTSENS